MLIRKATDLTYADVTPKPVYLNRRKFLQAMSIASATAVLSRRLYEFAALSQTALAATKFSGLIKSQFSSTEKENSFENVKHYNNFYEFGTDKSDHENNAQNFKVSNWVVFVDR